MSLYNHQLRFRPLRGGIEIYNEQVNEVGTLGFIAQDANGGPGRWLVSCHHVLIGGAETQAEGGEPVFQPSSSNEEIARIDAERCDASLDCAAAVLCPGIASNGEILGIGRVGGVLEPEPGMRVIKSGAATGVTEGLIAEVNGDDVIVAVLAGFDPNYKLSDRGDSGSLWLSRDDLGPVALHLGELGDPAKRVKAKRISTVLSAMRLKL